MLLFTGALMSTDEQKQQDGRLEMMNNTEAHTDLYTLVIIHTGKKMFSLNAL